MRSFSQYRFCDFTTPWKYSGFEFDVPAPRISTVVLGFAANAGAATKLRKDAGLSEAPSGVVAQNGKGDGNLVEKVVDKVT